MDVERSFFYALTLDDQLAFDKLATKKGFKIPFKLYFDL